MDGLYGGWHILYLVFSFGLTVAGLVLIKKFVKSDRAIRITLLSTACTLLFLICLGRVSDTMIKGDWREMLPYTFCPIACWILAFCVLWMKNRNHLVFHCFVYIAILGMLATLFAPGFFNENSAHHSPTIWDLQAMSSMLYHSCGLFLCLLLIVMREFKPDWRKLWILALGYCACIAWGVFLIDFVGMADQNPMYILTAIIDGTPLYWWVIALIYISVVFTVTFVTEFTIKKIRSRKNGV
jgi:uncharacterized membrane protein YwaF